METMANGPRIAARRTRVGRPPIGPKVQFCISEELHVWLRRELRLRGGTLKDWPELLREVMTAGAASVGRRSPR